MIPLNGGILPQSIVIKEQPSKTYLMNHDNKQIRGFADGINAMEQTIFNILNTERYKYVIYSWNYGIELSDLYGKDPSYVRPELKRRITEALLQDSRIEGIDGFGFSQVEQGKLNCSFIVHTIFGDISAEKVVAI